MKRIKKIGVLSTGKFLAALYAALGLIAGVFFGFMALMSQLGDRPMPWFFGFAIFFFPILYGVIGFVAGVIVSFMYNLVAKTMGGIEIEVE